MFSIILILSIIAGIVMIILVLLQPGKGDLSATFGGLSSQFGSMFGMKRTSDFLMKLTLYVAVAILVLAIAANKIIYGGPKMEQIKPVTEGAKAPINTMAPPPEPASKK